MASGEKAPHVDGGIFPHFDAKNIPQVAVPHPVQRNMGDKCIIEVIQKRHRTVSDYAHESFHGGDSVTVPLATAYAA
jgi:hypothetical protein